MAHPNRSDRSFIVRATHEYDSDRPLSTTVVSAVAEAKATDPTELPQLYDVIDPAALDAVFEPISPDRQRSSGAISFEFADLSVTVTGEGEVYVRNPA